MDILNKVTGQLMTGIEDAEHFFSNVAEECRHEWQCLTEDGIPAQEPTIEPEPVVVETLPAELPPVEVTPVEDPPAEVHPDGN